MKIALCEDNRLLLEKYKHMFYEIGQALEIELEVAGFECGEDLLEAVEQEDFHPDLLYLDVMLTGISGIETAIRMRENGYQGSVVFLTFQEFCDYQSVEGPVRCLSKGDITMEHLKADITNKVPETLGGHKCISIFDPHGEMKMIGLKDIICVKAKGNGSLICTEDQVYINPMGLEEMYEQLNDNQICRSAKGYLVQLSFIEGIYQNKIIMSNGEEIPVDQTYHKNLQNSFSKFLFSGM